ncbi:MAG: DNA-3-methyladenine glycosylase I [archaeon]
MVKKRWYKPKTDDAFLNDVSFIVFVVRFNYRLVEKKWPEIEKAFYQFNIQKLSKMNEQDLEPFMKAPGMIKNRWKIHAVLVNARKCAEIQKEHGSVLKWIAKAKKEFKKSPILAPELRDIFREAFRGIGPMTSTWLESLFLSDKTYVEYEM